MAKVENIGPSSTINRSGVGEIFCARASAVLRTRWTELRLGSSALNTVQGRFTHRGIYRVTDRTSP